MNRAFDVARIRRRSAGAHRVAREANLVAQSRLADRRRGILRLARRTRVGLSALARHAIQITRQRLHTLFHRGLPLIQPTLTFGAVSTGSTKLLDITLYTTLLFGQRASTLRRTAQAGTRRLFARVLERTSR